MSRDLYEGYARTCGALWKAEEGNAGPLRPETVHLACTIAAVTMDQMLEQLLAAVAADGFAGPAVVATLTEMAQVKNDLALETLVERRVFRK